MFIYLNSWIVKSPNAWPAFLESFSIRKVQQSAPKTLSGMCCPVTSLYSFTQSVVLLQRNRVKRQENGQRRPQRSHPFNHILANIIGSMHPPGKDTLEQSNFHLLMSTSELRGLLEIGHTQSWPPGPKSQPAWIFPWWEGSSPERFFKPPQLFWNSQDKTSHFTKKTEATVRILSNSFLLTNLHSYTHTFPFLLPSNYK